MENENSSKFNNVVLMLLPFWTPAIPPLGLACIKGYLKELNYRVMAYDANVNPIFREKCDTYFQILKDGIPEDLVMPHNTFFNLGNDILYNHMMAYINFTDENKYLELVNEIIYKSFYVKISNETISLLTGILEGFFKNLEKYIKEIVIENQPEVIGFSVYSHTIPATVYAARVVKRLNPCIQVVLGGGAFSNHLYPGSPNMDFFLEKLTEIDRVFIGEGERVFLKYLRGELKTTDKIVFAEKEDKQYDISRAVLPDFTDFHLDHYAILPHYSSRSCPYQCKFCSEALQWGTFRKKNTQQIVEELICQNSKCNIQLFWMCDSLLNPVIDYLSEELIKAKKSIYWDGYLRVNNAVRNTENTIKWRKGGFYRARLGIESGSQEVLDKMNKSVTVEQIKDSISSLATAGIKTTTYWVVGFPGETEEDFQKTLDLIEELQFDIYEAMCNPFNYHVKGQMGSDNWNKDEKRELLYPEWAKDVLIAQTWTLLEYPLREETYKRIRRFGDHCMKLGIPNPFTIGEIITADERWKKLHKNSVPSIIEFKGAKKIIEDSNDISHVLIADKRELDTMDFNFENSNYE